MSAKKIKAEIPFKMQVSATPGGANVLGCFLCGSCTACCPVSEIDGGYNPRKIMRMILLDKKDETLSSPEIWKCNQCHACVAHCPQDVRFADVLRSLRELAVDGGFAPLSLVGEIDEIDRETRKLRLEKISAHLAGNSRGGCS